jgi:hypothetical protein
VQIPGQECTGHCPTLNAIEGMLQNSNLLICETCT